LNRLIELDKKALSLSGWEAETKLRSLGIDVAKFPEWKSVMELRLVANCVKHAEGRACEELDKLRPDLFDPPSIGPRINGPGQFVERRLGRAKALTSRLRNSGKWPSV
jgi:hypothetical protein